MNMKIKLAFGAAFLPVFALLAATTQISVGLKMDCIDYVAGERVRAVVDIANSSPATIDVGKADSPDRFFVEVTRAGAVGHLERSATGAFIAPFTLKSNEGQKFETYLGDHYYLREPGRYFAKPVLVHGGVRFEGQLRAFSVVPGMKVASALQMFKAREGLRREFELLRWSRQNVDHLFLAAYDEGTTERKWVTTDLGPMMRLNKPTVTVLPTGEVVILHRYDRDHFLRTEFWSLPDVLEFQKHELVQDPETAGAERVRELYKESGGVQPKAHPWWKFW